jgi:hypothetical protein
VGANSHTSTFDPLAVSLTAATDILLRRSMAASLLGFCKLLTGAGLGRPAWFGSRSGQAVRGGVFAVDVARVAAFRALILWTFVALMASDGKALM